MRSEIGNEFGTVAPSNPSISLAENKNITITDHGNIAPTLQYCLRRTHMSANVGGTTTTLLIGTVSL